MQDLTLGIGYRGRRLRCEKSFFAGTHRSIPPEQTFERLSPLFKRAGITRIANITGLDYVGIPVCLAQRPNGQTLSNSAGKGVTLACSRVSAAMEGIELACAENFPEPNIYESYSHIAAGCQCVMDLEDLPLHSASLFRTDVPELWIPAWDIVSQREVLVPYEATCFSMPKRRRAQRYSNFVRNSNGLAGGNTLLEAVTAALYEVIERDAVAISLTLHEESIRPLARIDPEMASDPSISEMNELIRAAGLELLVFDVSVDTTVPCFMAVLLDDDPASAPVAAGYGAHLDPTIAMSRSITEAAQGRLVTIAGSRDDIFASDLQAFHAFRRGTVKLYRSVTLREDYQLPSSAAGSDFETDVLTLIRKLDAVGLSQVLVIEVNDFLPEVPVVRVMVPGLEGLHTEPYRNRPRLKRIMDDCRDLHTS